VRPRAGGNREKLVAPAHDGRVSFTVDLVEVVVQEPFTSYGDSGDLSSLQIVLPQKPAPRIRVGTFEPVFWKTIP
jgi:hypothetical protein